MKARNFVKKFLIYFFLAVGGFIMFFPFYWMITSVLKSPAEYNSWPPVWVPSNFLNFTNFVEAFKAAPFARFFLNSIIVTVTQVAINSFTTILAAFAFSRLKFRGREVIFGLLLSFMMVPFEMMVITNFRTVTSLGLIDKLPVLVIPFTTSIFYTYILKNFFQTIPDSLYYSAKIDGASNWKYLWRIMVPIAKPSLVTILLLNTIASWNSFMWTQLTINSVENRTIPMGVFVFMTDAGSNPQLQLAAATVTVLPMVILFLFCRKYIVNGVSSGGIKG